MSMPAVIAEPAAVEAEARPTLWDFVALPAHGAPSLVPADPESTGSIVETAPPPRRPPRPIMAEVDDYLWEVYQRDAHQAGCDRRLHLEGSGRRKTFRPLDAGLRDHWHGRGLPRAALPCRQGDGRGRHPLGDLQRVPRRLSPKHRLGPQGRCLQLAARRHARTGGYGHGRAVDVTSEDGDPAPVWKWLDRNGAKYGLHRPMPGGDPAHVQAQGAWNRIALALRQNRVGTAEAMRMPATKTAAAKAEVAKASW